MNRHNIKTAPLLEVGAFSSPEQALWPKPEARGGNKPHLLDTDRRQELTPFFCTNLPQSDIVNTERIRTPNGLWPDGLTYLT